MVGTGYVGLTTGACLAYIGHDVTCADIDARKIERLEQGELPIVEDGLEEIVYHARAAGRLSFCIESTAAVADADIVLLCVPTPQGDDGSADLTYVRAAAGEIGPALRPDAIVVNKSTVPVGSTEVVAAAIGRDDVHVASNPEFLREGVAVLDFLRPSRVVIGADEPHVRDRLATLYDGLGAEIFRTDAATAETIKYAANAFLATKISFINDMSYLCDAVGADVHDVADAIGMDPRIGRAFLNPGPGWGGSCFPKDSRALVSIAEDHGFDFPIMRSVISANDRHRTRIVEQVASLVHPDAPERLDGVQVTAFGLTFKAGTDDLRESPSLYILDRLIERGASVHAFDPTTVGELSPTQAQQLGGIRTHDDPLDAARGADIVLVLTEWPRFASLDWDDLVDVVRQPVVFDARDVVDVEAARGSGFTLHRLGRR